LFGDPEWEKVNDLRDAFQAQFGTWEEFQVKAQKAGVDMNAYLSAKTEEDWTKIQKNIEDKFAATDARDTFVKAAGGLQELELFAQKTGISLSDLFNAQNKSDVDAYTESFNELVDLQGQLADIAKDSAGKLGDSVGSAVTGIKILTPEDAAAQASIAMTAFTLKVKQDGLLAASDAFAPVAEALRLNMESIGVDASALLGPMFSQIALASNETFRAATTGAQAFADTLHAFRANELPLTVQQLGAFGTEAQTAFNQAVAGGASTQEAFVAIAPLLSQLQSAASQYGFTLDANTQSLINQAKASGVAFPVDPIDKIVAAIQKLIDKLDGVADSAANAGEAIASIGNPNVDVSYDPNSGYMGGYDRTGYPIGQPMASGGIVTTPSYHLLGEGGSPEAVIPLDQGGFGLSEAAMQTMLARFERSITKAFTSAAQKGS